MSPNRPAAVLLPLQPYEVFVVLDALVRFADEQEKDGDPVRVAPIADAIADRLRELKPLVTMDAVEMLRSVGLGNYANRPQG